MTPRQRWLAYRHRKQLHRAYLELHEEFPDDFPLADFFYDVPGCSGSYRRYKGEREFGNMINCRCHKPGAWWWPREEAS